jgi:hypothetical protein
MALNITKGGGKSLAPKIFLYGPTGIGKTTFAVGCPKPIIFDFDGGAGRYNVPTTTVSSVDELLDALTELQEMEYRTIVIDTLEALERMIFAEICREADVDSIEQAFGGFNKGYIAAGERMSRILDLLTALIPLRKMPVILGQAEVRKVSDPEGDYTAFSPRANKHISTKVLEWADIVLFATREQSAATGSGKRIMLTAPTKRGFAKSRLPLPEQVDLSFAPIAAALKQPKAVNEEEHAGF